MKKAVILILLAFVLSIASPVLAAVPQSVDKFIYGVTDVVKSPLALYDHTKIEMEEADHITFGFIKGLVVSPFHMVKRAGTGLVDILTFPIK